MHVADLSVTKSSLPQAQYDKLKRRALLVPTIGANQSGLNIAGGPDAMEMNGVRILY